MAVLIFENVIFTAAFGASTLIELCKKRAGILAFGAFITEFSVLSSIIAYLLELLIVKSEFSKRFMPCIFILSLGLVYIFTLIVIWFSSKKLFRAAKRYVHLAAFNCAVLSALFNNYIGGGALAERIVYAAEIGIGFVLAAYILSVNYDKLNSDDVPASFRGTPIYILYIGIISMIIYAVAR